MSTFMTKVIQETKMESLTVPSECECINQSCIQSSTLPEEQSPPRKPQDARKKVHSLPTMDDKTNNTSQNVNNVIKFILSESMSSPTDGIAAYSMLPSAINSDMLDEILGDLDDDSDDDNDD